MDPRAAPLAAIFDLTTDLLLNCLDGVSQPEARQRLDGGSNRIIVRPGASRTSGRGLPYVRRAATI